MTQVLKCQIMLKFRDMNEVKANKPREKVQVVVIAEGQLLLLEFNTNERHNYRGFQNITGGVEAGENFLTAAKRELLEETGLNAEVTKLDLEFHFIDRWDHSITEKVFLCVFEKKPPVKISAEHKSYKWIPIGQVHTADYLFASNFEAFQKALEHLNQDRR